MRVCIVQGDHVLEHHRYWGKAFADGLHATGQRMVEACDADWREDLAVFWGHNRPQLIQQIRDAGGHYLVMERGYVGNRYEHTSLGFDGLNGHAIFPGRDNPRRDRWEALGRQVPRRSHASACSNYVLIAGQVAGDASLRGINLRDWYDRQIAAVRKLGFIPIFRQHPESRHWDGPTSCDISCKSLEQDLADARAVITFNSNLGVDAALAGCAVIATDEGSMAWDVAGHSAETLQDVYGWLSRSAHQAPNFMKWCHGLAYCQWTHDEISSGAAWDHLRSFYEPASHR